MSNNVLPIPLQAQVENQGTTYLDQKIEDGDYFSGFLTRTSTVPETIYRVIKTGSVPLIIEGLDSEVDYSSVSDGEFTVSSRLYVDGSNSNTWSYTGGTSVKVGVPLNLSFINKIPEFDLITNPVMTGPTGTEDFVISFIQYYKDTSGNTETLEGISDSFFRDSRKLIIPANTEVLVETITSGDSGNTGQIRTLLSVIEPGEY